jgi:hypothetical protein
MSKRVQAFWFSFYLQTRLNCACARLFSVTIYKPYKVFSLDEHLAYQRKYCKFKKKAKTIFVVNFATLTLEIIQPYPKVDDRNGFLGSVRIMHQ